MLNKLIGTLAETRVVLGRIHTFVRGPWGINMSYCTYIDIQKFNIKYLVMYKVQMHTGVISKLEYGSCVCTGDNPLADARGLSSRTDAQTIL